MDGAGKIGLAGWIEADDDEHAVIMARAIKAGTLECEVWQNSRLVASLDAKQLSTG